ncbi:MAG: DUF4397 domain-containing protein [Streptosporangiaceae bacterium]
MRLTPRISVIAHVLAAGALSFGLVTAGQTATSAAARTGWLRLAHLSPNTPAVDVYLYSSGNPRARVVLHHVSYGTVSPYLAAAPGVYTVAMRPAGAAASSAPVLSTAVHVRAGGAYTVAGMGPAKGLRLQVITDRLTTPRGHAMIRVIQASMREHRVTVRAGHRLLGKNLAFATTTSYMSVFHGRMAVQAVGLTERVLSKLTFQAGSIHTLVVLDEPGRLRLDNLKDAAGSKVWPGHSPDTGFGGTAPRPGSSSLTWLAFITAGLLIAGSGLVRNRRGRAAAGRRRRGTRRR